MAYDISVPDVDGYWTGYENYHTSMNDALDEVKRALSDLMLLESFQGAAAASTKLYFQEVHLPIITGLITLAKYVGTDLSGFVQGFSAAPVNENKDARLPNDALARARGKLQDTFAAGDLNEIDGLSHQGEQPDELGDHRGQALGRAGPAGAERAWRQDREGAPRRPGPRG